MLAVSDLIDINYIPSENDISLELLVNFYEDYLCKRIFIFTLRDGRVVKLFFRDATEVFHVSGIDHVYEGVPMDGSRFLQEIKAGNVDLETVKNVNPAAYRDYEIRIRSMACIDTIIKNCEYLWYPSGKIPDSEIEVKYLLLKGLDEKNLHLGIDTYKANRPYFAKTLLITEGDKVGKFIAKADERLKVSKLEIRDKDTNQLFVCVERELAEHTALAEAKRYAKEWLDKELPVLLGQLWEVSCGDDLWEIWIQTIQSETCAFDSDVKLALEMKEDASDSEEWKSLLIDVIAEKLSDKAWFKNMLFTTMGAEYENVLCRGISTATKKIWCSDCRKYVELHKHDIKDKVQTLDAYWAAKISAEAIRKYVKEVLENELADWVREYITQAGKDVVADIVMEKIIEQKDRM